MFHKTFILISTEILPSFPHPPKEKKVPCLTLMFHIHHISLGFCEPLQSQVEQHSSRTFTLSGKTLGPWRDRTKELPLCILGCTITVGTARTGTHRPAPCVCCCRIGEGGLSCFFHNFPAGETAGWLPVRLLGKLCEETISFSNHHEAVFLRKFARIEIVLIFNQDTERLIPYPYLPLLRPPTALRDTPCGRICFLPHLPASSQPPKKFSNFSPKVFLSGYIQTCPSLLIHCLLILQLFISPTSTKQHLPGTNVFWFQGIAGVWGAGLEWGGASFWRTGRRELTFFN